MRRNQPGKQRQPDRVYNILNGMDTLEPEKQRGFVALTWHAAVVREKPQQAAVTTAIGP